MSQDTSQFRPVTSLFAPRVGLAAEGVRHGPGIFERKSGNVTILDLKGRVVIGKSNDSLAAELRKLAGNAPCNVLINLADVVQVDSSGISTLVRSFVTLSATGQPQNPESQRARTRDS